MFQNLKAYEYSMRYLNSDYKKCLDLYISRCFRMNVRFQMRDIFPQSRHSCEFRRSNSNEDCGKKYSSCCVLVRVRQTHKLQARAWSTGYCVLVFTLSRASY